MREFLNTEFQLVSRKNMTVDDLVEILIGVRSVIKKMKPSVPIQYVTGSGIAICGNMPRRYDVTDVSDMMSATSNMYTFCPPYLGNSFNYPHITDLELIELPLRLIDKRMFDGATFLEGWDISPVCKNEFSTVLKLGLPFYEVAVCGPRPIPTGILSLLPFLSNSKPVD